MTPGSDGQFNLRKHPDLKSLLRRFDPAKRVS